MEYRDSTQETQHKQTIQLQTENKNLQHSLRVPRRQYNLINHTGQPHHSGCSEARAGRVRGQRDYNLLSHFQNKLHEAAPMNYDDFYAKECQMKPKALHKPSSRQREFNILSNHYQHDHEARQRGDHEAVQERMRKKYWETHHYDPITVQSYDLKEEEEYHAQAQRKIDRQLKKKIDQYPTRSASDLPCSNIFL
jgi:hypothetical protein